MGVELDSERWYDHVPRLIGTGHESKVSLLWNKQVQTERTVRNNKPDIITCDNEKGTYMALDVAVSAAGRNVIKKEAENILKYKDLTI